MSSTAFSGHLLLLLEDADALMDAHRDLRAGRSGRGRDLGPLNRAAVIACVSAWEAYVEELVRESLSALRPPAPPLGVWPALNASVRGQLGRFNNPNTENVRMLFSDSIGLPDIHLSWSWRDCTPEQAVRRLTEAMTYRHQIAHGVNPRPVIENRYSRDLPNFFRSLGRRTDDAVRHHLVAVHGAESPWPA